MKYLFFLIFFFNMAASNAQPAPSKNSEEEKQISWLMVDWMRAVKDRDEKTLNRIVAPEFTLDAVNNLDEPGLPRNIWMANTMQFLKIDSVNYPKMKVEVYGGTAVVRSTFYWAGKFKENSFSDSSAILIDTWVKRPQGWQVVSRLMVDK